MWGVALESLDNGAHFWFLTGSFKGNKSQSLHLREQRRERELAWDATWTLLGSTGGEVFPEVRKGSLCSLASPDCALNLPSQWSWLSNSSLIKCTFLPCVHHLHPSQPLASRCGEGQRLYSPLLCLLSICRYGVSWGSP